MTHHVTIYPNLNLSRFYPTKPGPIEPGTVPMRIAFQTFSPTELEILDLWIDKMEGPYEDPSRSVYIHDFTPSELTQIEEDLQDYIRDHPGQYDAYPHPLDLEGA